jgi:hypothetical protein
MSFAVQLIIQFVVLVAAMVVAGLIIRWISANPQKCKSALRRIKRRLVAPGIWIRSYRAYCNWKKVGMGFSYKECRDREWQKYDDKNNPEQPYYRL